MNRHPLQLRRDFLKTGATTASALLAGGLLSGHLTSAMATPPPPRKLRLLILGGTGFIGPWMARKAVARGHQVTLFNRGRREKFRGAADGTERLYGNRDPNLYAHTKFVDGKEVEDQTSPKGLSELEGKQWDAVIDNSGYVPRIVRASAELLAPNVGQYLFISTISVYAGSSKPGADESATLATIDDPTNEDANRNYGPLKALCEQAAEEAMPGRVTILRPGYIVGPGDTTDRFTYWPLRVDRGGEVLVPGNPDDPVQFIDARDLASFAIHCLESQILGHYNVTGPEERFTNADLMAACQAASAAGDGSGKQQPTFTYIPYNWLAANGCPAGKLPILLPATGSMTGFHQRSISKALSKGLTFRPVEETCRDLISWWPEEIEARTKVAQEVREQRQANGLAVPPQVTTETLRTGLSAEDEAKLLAQWHAKGE